MSDRISVGQRCYLWLQYILPHHALSRLIYLAARWRWRPWKNLFIKTIVRRFDVDLDEAVSADINDYGCFADFFTRELKPGMRPVSDDPAHIVSPSDSVVSQCGRIDQSQIFQAKGHQYSVRSLVGGDADLARQFENGYFSTLYLSPRDYHRVHMPLAGRLKQTIYVPGRLFSVAPLTVDHIPGLFARNERLVCVFDGDSGPFIVVMVGAMLVSSIETVWDGEQPRSRSVFNKSFESESIELGRGAEMARFNMGSTVILVLPETVTELSDTPLKTTDAVKMGQPIAQIRTKTA